MREIENMKRRLGAKAADAEIPEVIPAHRDEDIALARFGEDEKAGLPACGHLGDCVPEESLLFKR
jgi:hypothetical protein